MNHPSHPSRPSARARPGRRLRATLAVLTVAGLAVSCSQQGGREASSRSTTTTTGAPDPSTTTTTTPGELSWSECDGGFQCATLEVPVDYDQPDGPTLELGLVKREARDPANRIGSLLMDPGGPGASAVEFVEGYPMPGDVSQRFDIVGFDPRGVGRSSALDCHGHLQEIYDADPTMEDQDDIDHYLSVSQAFVDECEAKYADLLPHLGTVDVARDMDSVRAALGEDRISYLGYSYGTSIGQQYARLFPERVRAMVLDGVVDTSQTGLEGAEGQAEGFTRALDSFIAHCDQQGCGLDGPAGTVLDRVIATSEAEPIPAPGADRPAGPAAVSLGLGQALYSEQLWPRLARALGEADAGDGTGMVRLADDYLQRSGDGTYPSGFEIYFGVSCIDARWPKDPAVVLAKAKEVGRKYPRVGETLVNDYVRCALWPSPPQPLPQVPTDITGLPPIMVVSTTNDPATPYESGVKVAEQIPDARLVTNVGEGHTVVGRGKACIDDAFAAYMIDLTPPEDGLRCE